MRHLPYLSLLLAFVSMHAEPEEIEVGLGARLAAAGIIGFDLPVSVRFHKSPKNRMYFRLILLLFLLEPIKYIRINYKGYDFFFLSIRNCAPEKKSKQVRLQPTCFGNR